MDEFSPFFTKEKFMRLKIITHEKVVFDEDYYYNKRKLEIDTRAV